MTISKDFLNEIELLLKELQQYNHSMTAQRIEMALEYIRSVKRGDYEI